MSNIERGPSGFDSRGLDEQLWIKIRNKLVEMIEELLTFNNWSTVQPTVRAEIERRFFSIYFKTTDYWDKRSVPDERIIEEMVIAYRKIGAFETDARKINAESSAIELELTIRRLQVAINGCKFLFSGNMNDQSMQFLMELDQFSKMLSEPNFPRIAVLPQELSNEVKNPVAHISNDASDDRQKEVSLANYDNNSNLVNSELKDDYEAGALMQLSAEELTKILRTERNRLWFNKKNYDALKPYFYFGRLSVTFMLSATIAIGLLVLIGLHMSGTVLRLSEGLFSLISGACFLASYVAVRAFQDRQVLNIERVRWKIEDRNFSDLLLEIDEVLDRKNHSKSVVN